MEFAEEIRYQKYLIPHPSSLVYRRDCRERFGSSLNPVGPAAIDTINGIDGEIKIDAFQLRNLLIAGIAGILIRAAGCLMFG